MTELKVMQSPVAVQAERPLCVDLDGTLVKSDTFVDSLMVLARRHPIGFLQTPGWILKGKAHFKSQVASMVTLDVAHLPYNRPLLDYLRDEHTSGRKLYLATGADRVLARKIALLQESSIFHGIGNRRGEIFHVRVSQSSIEKFHKSMRQFYAVGVLRLQEGISLQVS